MESLNFLDDIEKYKKFGNLTQPLLPKEMVYEQVMLDVKNNQKDENSSYFLYSLCLWIHYNVKYSNEKDIQNQKFSRNLEELW